MRVIDSGHRYELDHLESGSKTVFQFVKDPLLHSGDGAEGPTCQEVLRAIIDRVKSLQVEKPDPENDLIVYHGRMMIAGFEARALRRRVEKDGLAIELLPVSEDGHLAFRRATDKASKGDVG